MKKEVYHLIEFEYNSLIMKNILISFIRNDHLELLKENNHLDLDITRVTENRKIDRIFLLTNQDREESINFKNWIAEKLERDVKAVTLEKGSEKYILNKIESIIKYILLAEEGHASFTYLPGENTLQINLWEIVDKTIYKGKIVYPHMLGEEAKEAAPLKKTKPAIPVQSKIVKKTSSVTTEKKIFTVNAPEIPVDASPEEKIKKALGNKNNMLLCGEEGTGKTTKFKKALNEKGLEFHVTNFRSINPDSIEEKVNEISKMVHDGKITTFLFLNIEVLPFYIQEQISQFDKVHILSTVNIAEPADLEKLNRRLYFLLSKNVLTLKPVRIRREELPELIDQIIKSSGSGAVVSDKAMTYLIHHNWPGNFNELNSVISRLCSETSSIITEELARESLDRQVSELNQWRDLPMGENFNLNDVLGEVAMHYIMEALEICQGKKSKAAKMLGFSNYQTLSNWMKRYSK